jgi:hypothetical protein
VLASRLSTSITADQAFDSSPLSQNSPIHTPDESVAKMAHEVTVKKERSGSAKIPVDDEPDLTACLAHVHSHPHTLDISQLDQLVTSENLLQLHNAIEAGRQLLLALVEPIADAKDKSKAPLWLDRINKLRHQDTQARAIVAIVGGTGAGKSSTINAVLNEDRLVPTNGVRSCTAVVVEISYNHDPSSCYRAEVEFISAEDWKTEFNIIWTDLFDEKGLCRDYQNADSEAGIAYAKIRALFPRQTQSKELIATCDPKKLLTDTSVTELLGNIRKLEESNPKAFYRQVKVYMDSKDRHGGGTSTKPLEMAFWPLIKVVKLYVKSEVLSTGVVLVDLVSCRFCAKLLSRRLELTCRSPVPKTQTQPDLPLLIDIWLNAVQFGVSIHPPFP